MSASPYEHGTAEVSRLLADTASELNAAGAKHAARRLRVVDEFAARLDYPALERLADPKLAADELTALKRRRLRAVHVIRDIMLFLPLLWAMIALVVASISYNELSRYTLRITESFWVLWQHGFDGRSLTFVQDVLIDVLITILAAAAVAYSRWIEVRESRRQIALVDDLYAAMGQIAVAIEKNRYSESAPPGFRPAQAAAEGQQQVAVDLGKLVRDFDRSARNALESQSRLNEQFIGTVERQDEAHRRALAHLETAARESGVNSAAIATALAKIAEVRTELSRDLASTTAAKTVTDADDVRQFSELRLAKLIDSVDALLRSQHELNREFLLSRQPQHMAISSSSSSSSESVAINGSELTDPPEPAVHRRSRSITHAFTDGVGGIFDLLGGIRQERLGQRSFQDSLEDGARSLCLALGLVSQGNNSHEDGLR